MLTSFLRFEWRYHTRQASFFAAAAFLLLMGFAITASRFGPDNVAVNSSFLVMEAMGLLSLLALFAVAIFASNAVLRDVEHGMLEIVYTTPVGRFHYLFGRYAGAALATFTVAAMSGVGMIVASFMPWIEPERVGPFSIVPYLWSLLVVMLPNVLFGTALLFAIAVLTRSAVATYVGAVVTYLLYLVVAALTNSPLMAQSKPRSGDQTLVALLDPFALSSFFELTRYWSIAEKNERFVPLAGNLLANRLLWLAVSMAIFAFVYKVFAFRIVSRSKRRNKRKSGPDDATAAGAVKSGIDVATALRMRPRIAPRWLSSYLSTTRIEWRALAWNLPFLLLLVLWMVVAAVEIRSEVFDAEFGTVNFPTTPLILSALRQPLTVFGTILLVYLAAEVFWRDQRYRMSSIINTTSAPGSVMIAAKWTALAGLIAAVIASGILVGVVMQLASGYTNFQPLLYLSMFYFAGLPLMLLAAAAAMIHVLSPGKYTGMVLVFLFFIVRRAGDAIGLSHPLVQFANAPSVTPTGMNGFGPDVAPFNALMLHWSLFSLLLLLLTSLMWRGIDGPLRDRIRLAVRRSVTRQRVMAMTLALLSTATGGWIFYNTNVLNDFVSQDEMNDWRAEYEKSYRRLLLLPQPTTTDIDVTVDLFPSEHRYRTAGIFTLANQTAHSISSIWITVRRDATELKLSIDGARTGKSDERFGTHRFDLDRPLRPGERTKFHYDFTVDPRGFEAGEQDTPILSNGTFLIGFRLFPSIGYRSTFELGDPRERDKRGLGKRERTEEESDAFQSSTAPRVNVTSTVSTSSDQIAIASGTLVRSWEKGKRRYFRYRTEAPVANAVAYGSGRWKVAKRQAGDVAIELYHHPEHHHNVERMLEAAAKSIETFEKSFGPYPHRELRMAEVVRQPYAGYASPGVVWFVENRAMLTDARNPERLDVVTRRTVHEVAHQWWGHQVAPAVAPGASFLVETMAKHSESMMIERLRDREHLDHFLEMELDRYLVGRSRSMTDEDPLLRVDSQPHVYYAKGAIVMNAITREIGETAVNDALRGLIREPNPTSAHVLPNLRRVAPPRSYPLIEEWLTKIVLYDFRLDSATATRRGDGRYDLTLRIDARKSHADERGNEHLVALRETVEIAAVKPDGTPIHVGRYPLRDGAQELTIVVDELPAAATIDPHVTRVDKSRLDNTRKVDR